MTALPTIYGSAGNNLDSNNSTYYSFTYNTADESVQDSAGNTPTDFGTMDSGLTWTVDYRLSQALSDDTISLSIAVRDAAGTTVLAGADSTISADWVVVNSNVTNTTDTTTGPTAFTYVNQTADKTAWDGAVVWLRMQKAKSGGWDPAYLQVDYYALNGTYTESVTERTIDTVVVAGAGVAATSAWATRFITAVAAAGSGDVTSSAWATRFITAAAAGAGDLTTSAYATAFIPVVAAAGAGALVTSPAILSLYTFRPNGDGTLSGNVESGGWADIDDDPDTPTDTDYVVNVAGATASAFFDLTPAPSDYDTGDSITVTARASSHGTSGSQELYYQLFESDESTPITVEVSPGSFTVDEVRTDSDVAMAWSSGAPTKTQLDGARLRVRWTV